MELKNITGNDLYEALCRRVHLLVEHLASTLKAAEALQEFLEVELRENAYPVGEAAAETILDYAAEIINGTQKSHREICSYGLYRTFLEGYCADTVYMDLIYKADGISSRYLKEENVFVVTCVLLPSKSNKKFKIIMQKSFGYERTVDIFAEEILNTVNNTIKKEQKNIDFMQIKQGNLAVYYCYNYSGLSGRSRAADATNHYTDQLQNSALMPFGGDGGTTRISFENFFMTDAKEGTYIIVSLDGNKRFSDGDIASIIRKVQQS